MSFDPISLTEMDAVKLMNRTDTKFVFPLSTLIKILPKLQKHYRILEIDFKEFSNDLSDEKENIKFTDLELIFKDLKNLFEKKGYIINWNLLKNQSLDETINALAMASPFSLEEKQILLEAKNLDLRKNKIAEILKTYSHDVYNNNTIQ